MPKKRKILCGLLFLVSIAINNRSFAQDYSFNDSIYLDSLIRLSNTLPDDTSRLNLLYKISYKHYNIDSTEKYARLTLGLASQFKDYYKVGKSYYFLGWCEYYRSNYPKSCDYYYTSLAIFDSLDNKIEMGLCYNGLAQSLYEYQDFIQADTCLQSALKIFYELNDTVNISASYRNLGYFCVQSGLYSVSENYYRKALEFDLKSHDNNAIAEDYYGIGLADYFIYSDLKQDSFMSKSKKHLLKAYEMLSGGNNIYVYMQTVQLLRDVYFSCDNGGNIGKTMLDSSLFFRDKEMELIKMTGYEESVASSKTKDILYYTKTGNYVEIEKIISEIEPLIEDSLLSTYVVVDFYNVCHSYYKAIGNYKKALECKEKEIFVQANCFNRDLGMRLIKSDAKVGYEKTLRQRELKNFEENIRIQEKLKIRNISICFVTACCILMAILAIVIARSLLRHRRISAILMHQRNMISERNEELKQQTEEISVQRDKIEKQRNDLEIINERMTESIQYAKRIQSAAIPSLDLLSQMFGEVLIYWKPLDIVSGDFYWAAQKGPFRVLAVADCTGHGVPGAFMSILGISSLNDIVLANDISRVKASEILDQLKYKLINSLHQKNGIHQTHDGIDISLCIFNYEDMTAQYAGAYRSLIVMRNGEMIEHKGDKMPVGYHAIMKDKLFTNCEFPLVKGDVIYMYTDGLPDQFGIDETGNKSKFCKVRFVQLIKDVYLKPFSEQKNEVEKRLSDWTENGRFEQIDDQLLVGIKI